MSGDLGECPNNTENTVCLSPSCKYKHDRVWLDPEEIKSGLAQWEGTFIEREVDYEVFLGSRQNVPELHESYVDRMLKTQIKCPCGCGGIFDLPKKKETENAQGNDEE